MIEKLKSGATVVFADTGEGIVFRDIVLRLRHVVETCIFHNAGRMAMRVEVAFAAQPGIQCAKRPAIS